MPTVNIDIKTGIEFSPTERVDSNVKLHNFIVGGDGSLYKIPALKNNYRGTFSGFYYDLIGDPSPFDTGYVYHQMIDIKKYETFQLYSDISPPSPPSPIIDIPEYALKTEKSFRRFVYLNSIEYGALNLDYSGDRIDESSFTGDKAVLKTFSNVHYKGFTTSATVPPRNDLNTFSNKIIIDLNSQYSSTTIPRTPSLTPRAIFPSQHITQDTSTFKGFPNPRNIVSSLVSFSATENDVNFLTYNNQASTLFDSNDIARGPILIGNRMIFYSVYNNSILISEPNNFSKLKLDENDQLFKIVPPEQIQSITDFNGNIITFTPTGMERWLISTDQTKILERDPTFHFDYRTRFNGSFVKANKDLYFYTDDLHAYRLNSNLSVDNVFNGQLPVYKPLYKSQYANTSVINDDFLELDYPCSHFKMLGSRFVSMGPWLYNIDTATWSTYNFDGWKNPTGEPLYDTKPWYWSNDTNKQTISAGFDDIVSVYGTISRFLTYEEMQNTTTFNPTEPTFNDGVTLANNKKYQWGEVAYLTTRMYQDERTFSLDGIEVYVRGGMLTKGVSKLYLKVLLGSDQGDFNFNDSSTWGQEATYQTMDTTELGDTDESHVGKFIWRTNIKTDRFRLQIVTNEKRGIVIQSVMANITHISDSQDYLVKQSQKK